jgi:hypothetical protein
LSGVWYELKYSDSDLKKKVRVQSGNDVVEHDVPSPVLSVEHSRRPRFQYIENPEKKKGRYDNKV